MEAQDRQCVGQARGVVPELGLPQGPLHEDEDRLQLLDELWLSIRFEAGHQLRDALVRALELSVGPGEVAGK